MKRILTTMVAVAMLLTMSGCRGGSSDNTNDNFKIGIITGTVSQGEEEFRAAENMKAKYGDMIVTSTYPDNFSTETETTISNVASLASDPDVKVIVFVQAITGASAAIDKVRETRDDILFICGVPAENPDVIASKADIVIQANELAMGKSIVEEAVKLGAENIVHYSFPRHMSYELLAARRDIMKEESIKAGINFIEATAPDPNGDQGIPGAQQFILEDVPRKIDELGPQTVFFSTNCSMQEPLIRRVLENKALLVQQCCPSPLHGYPGALGIEIPDEEQGNITYLIDQISDKIESQGNSGRMGTWDTAVNMLMIEAGVEYGIKYCKGETDGRVDSEVFLSLLDDIRGTKTTVETYDKDGVQIDNFFMVFCDYIYF